MTLAAVIAVSLLAVLIVFQLALALGAPLGDMAWGGRQSGVLPRGLRVLSAVAGLVVYPALILVVLSGAGLYQVEGMAVIGSGTMWLLAGIFVFAAVMNGASRSKRERIWAAVALVIAGCCAVIALGL